MLARLIGLGLTLLGVTFLRRARGFNDRVFQINADWFGWAPGRALRVYGLVVTIATGLVMTLLGLALVVAGADGLGD